MSQQVPAQLVILFIISHKVLLVKRQKGCIITSMSKWQKVRNWTCFWLTALILVCSPAAQAVTAGTWTGACVGASDTKSSDVATIQGIVCLIANVSGVAMGIFSMVGFCMFVYASFKLMISSGSPGDFTTAKGTFVYVVIGFVVALSSYIIMQLIQNFTGVDSFFRIQFFSQDHPEIPS